MSEPFLGEIKLWGINFAPRGWALCDGQLLPINQNQSLYSLLGTTYGGDGRTTFALPDLRGRVPVHKGDMFVLGEKWGAETVTLKVGELAAHSHAAKGTVAPGDKYAGASSESFGSATELDDPIYGNPANLKAMNAGMISSAGGSMAHNNMQPSMVLTFCIALQGLFPSRN